MDADRPPARETPALPKSQPATRSTDGSWLISPSVRGIADDSRTLAPGELFVAVRGSHDDGHRHLDEAFARGAAAAVVDDPALAAGAPPGLALLTVRSAREALGELASTWYGHPTRSLEMIGVTGTNGKTTVAAMLTAILKAAGRPAHSVGTLGPFPPEPGYPLTTPFPLQLQRTLRRLHDHGARAVVMEVSSHGLTQHRVAGCEFDAAILTSLSRDHLDYHRSIKAYWAAKIRLFKLLAQPNHKARRPVAILPRDGEGAAAVARHVRVPCLRFGLSEASDIRATDIRATPWGSRFLLHMGTQTVTARIHLPGRFNVENALAAAAGAHAVGVDGDAIVRGLDAVRRVSGRCERLMLPGGGFCVIDYAHNPDGLGRILEAVRQSAPGRRVVSVFGGRGHRDAGKLPGMGEVAAAFANALVLTSDSPLDEDPRDLAAAIEAGIPAGSDLVVEYIEERERAIERAVRLAGRGGIVVITGRGHERQQWLGERVLERSDADMARAAGARVRDAWRNGAGDPGPGGGPRPIGGRHLGRRLERR